MGGVEAERRAARSQRDRLPHGPRVAIEAHHRRVVVDEIREAHAELGAAHRRVHREPRPNGSAQTSVGREVEREGAAVGLRRAIVVGGQVGSEEVHAPALHLDLRPVEGTIPRLAIDGGRRHALDELAPRSGRQAGVRSPSRVELRRRADVRPRGHRCVTRRDIRGVPTQLEPATGAAAHEEQTHEAVPKRVARSHRRPR